MVMFHANAFAACFIEFKTKLTTNKQTNKFKLQGYMDWLDFSPSSTMYEWKYLPIFPKK